MGKKALCLIFAFLLSINTFAAVISDNDGAAFITKAEFEAMKKDFNEQVDNYNNSIDSKIDGAIASYLNGINLSKPFYVSSNIKEIKYPLQIVHHIKLFEEADDNVSTSAPQIEPLWSPRWNILSVNVRGNYRVLDKTTIPSYDKVNKFFGGMNEDTSSTSDFKLSGMTSGFEKTMNLFFQIDGWGTVDDSGYSGDSTLLSYAILCDDKGTANWESHSLNAWFNRNSYVQATYHDYEVYNELDDDYFITTASTKQTRSVNQAHTFWKDDWRQWKCDNENAFIGPNHTSAFRKDGNTQDLGSVQEYSYFDIICNNCDGDALAPVSYYNTYTDGKKWDIYYTNKTKNRQRFVYTDTRVNRSTWAFYNRTTNTAGANYGISEVLTRGYNLESELENTGRAWYKKSLIKQSRLKYDFSTENKDFADHKMGKGIPLYYFDKKELNGSEIDEFEIEFTMSTAYPSNKKYIVFSKKPITLSNYAQDVESNPDYEKIAEFNGIKCTTDPRKIEIVNGRNKIKLKDFIDGEIIYYKILWDTTNTKGGTNYDDEYIEIKDLELKIVL